MLILEWELEIQQTGVNMVRQRLLVKQRWRALDSASFATERIESSGLDKL